MARFAFVPAVHVIAIASESGGDGFEFRGFDEDAVYAAALTAKNAIDAELVPVVAQYRDIASGEWVVHVRALRGACQ